MNTEKVKSADEIAEEIGQWFYGGTDEKRMMLVHRIKNAIESERRKKDESYAKLEAEKVALEARLAEACRVLKGMLEVPDLMKAEQVNLAIKKMDDAKAFLNSPTPPLQKGCVHDNGWRWELRDKDSRWLDGKGKKYFPTCPFYKPKEPDTLGKCGSWISFNGEEYSCPWPKDHMGCHSTYAKGNKIKWKALDAGGGA